MLRLILGRRRSPKNKTLRCLVISAFILIIGTITEVLVVHHALGRATATEPINFLQQQKVFIAAIHWNNEEVLRQSWIPTLVTLTKRIGPENVFVSIYESGSWDNTKEALRHLDFMLADSGIPKKIVLDDTTHLDEISRSPSDDGWIETPRGRTELRRIPYLSRLRNVAMQPFYELWETGFAFDKILFLNDVVFESLDVQRLLDTRNGNYAAACALDFSKPPAFYDTFALRDLEGHEAIMQEWPYFRSRASRKALKYGQPTPVTSCWNGIIALDAKPFYQHPRLAFRGVSDSLAKLHIEGSECCLIHADNPFSRVQGVWLNPNVRVGYDSRAYNEVNPESSSAWVPLLSIARGLWINRLKRWFSSAWVKEAIVRRRLTAWMGTHTGNEEPGTSCLINEMQVLVANGWAHV